MRYVDGDLGNFLFVLFTLRLWEHLDAILCTQFRLISQIVGGDYSQ